MTTKWRIERLVESAAEMHAEFERMEAEIQSLKQPFGKFEEYEEVPGERKSVNVERDSEWLEFVRLYEEGKPIVERNAARVKANQALLKRLVETIEATGVRKTYRKWVRNKIKHEDADWYSALKGACPPYPTTTEEYERRFNDRKRYRDEHVRKQEQFQRQEEIRQQNEARERRRNVRVIELALQLGLDASAADFAAVSEAIRAKDKYLDLAQAGMATRGDWSDGPWQVTDALSRFKVETSADAEIASEWRGICDDFDDGRAFRDCEWNYNRVMELASPEVLAMWKKLVSDDA